MKDMNSRGKIYLCYVAMFVRENDFIYLHRTNSGKPFLEYNVATRFCNQSVYFTIRYLLI